MKACAEGIVDVVNLILNDFGEHTEDFFEPIEYDAGKNGFSFMTICNRLTPRIKRSNYRKSSFLHLATENGQYDIVCLLVENGAKINAVDCCGRSPVMLSLKHPKITKFLIGNGACINHQDKLGHTLLMTLVLSITSVPPDSTDLDLFDFILKSGVNPNLTDQSGQSVVHHIFSKECRLLFHHCLVEQGIIPTCNNAGMLMHAGNLLCLSDINYDLECLFPSEKIPADLQLSLKYFSFILVATKRHVHQTNIDAFMVVLRDALDFKARNQVVIEYPSSHVFATEEYRDSHSMEKKLPLLLQGMIIAERVCGYGSFLAIKLLLLNNLMKIPAKIGILPFQKIQFLIRASEMILFRARKHRLDWDTLKLVLLALDPKILPELANVKHTDQLFPFFENIFQSISIFLSSLRGIHSHQHSLRGTYIQTVPHNCAIKDLYSKSLTLALYLFDKCSEYINVNVIGRIMFSNIQTVWLPDTDMSIFPWLLTDNTNDAFLAKVLEWGGDKWINVPNISQRYLLHSLVKRASDVPRLNILLQYGAHPDVCGRTVGTPLMLAKRKKNDKAVKLLSMYYPLPLSCQAASVVANEIDDYHLLDLPRKVKLFISLHDSHGVDSGIDYTALLMMS